MINNNIDVTGKKGWNRVLSSGTLDATGDTFSRTMTSNFNLTEGMKWSIRPVN